MPFLRNEVWKTFGNLFLITKWTKMTKLAKFIELKSLVYNSSCTRRDIQSFFLLEALCIILYSSFLHWGYSSPSMSVKIIASWKISWKLRMHLLTGVSKISEFKFSTTFRSKTRLLISFRVTDGSDFSRKHAWTFFYFFEGRSFWRKKYFLLFSEKKSYLKFVYISH